MYLFSRFIHMRVRGLSHSSIKIEQNSKKEKKNEPPPQQKNPDRNSGEREGKRYTPNPMLNQATAEASEHRDVALRHGAGMPPADSNRWRESAINDDAVKRENITAETCEKMDSKPKYSLSSPPQTPSAIGNTLLMRRQARAARALQHAASLNTAGSRSFLQQQHIAGKDENANSSAVAFGSSGGGVVNNTTCCCIATPSTIATVATAGTDRQGLHTFGYGQSFVFGAENVNLLSNEGVVGITSISCPPTPATGGTLFSSGTAIASPLPFYPMRGAAFVAASSVTAAKTKASTNSTLGAAVSPSLSVTTCGSPLVPHAELCSEGGDGVATAAAMSSMGGNPGSVCFSGGNYTSPPSVTAASCFPTPSHRSLPTPFFPRSDRNDLPSSQYARSPSQQSSASRVGAPVGAAAGGGEGSDSQTVAYTTPTTAQPSAHVVDAAAHVAHIGGGYHAQHFWPPSAGARCGSQLRHWPPRVGHGGYGMHDSSWNGQWSHPNDMPPPPPPPPYHQGANTSVSHPHHPFYPMNNTTTNKGFYPSTFPSATYADPSTATDVSSRDNAATGHTSVSPPSYSYAAHTTGLQGSRNRDDKLSSSKKRRMRRMLLETNIQLHRQVDSIIADSQLYNTCGYNSTNPNSCHSTQEVRHSTGGSEVVVATKRNTKIGTNWEE